MKPIRIISWIFTVIFGLLFLVNWIRALSTETVYGSPGTSIPYILGMLSFCAIIPAILWIITYFVEKEK